MTAIVVGCATSDSGDDTGEDTTDSGPAASSSSTSTLPPPSQGDDSGTPDKDAGKDAGKKPDSGKVDSGVDAGPPPPVPGDPCTKPNDIQKKQCGACGTQSTVCLATDDASTGTWSDYGACEGEVAGGCIPGTTDTVACGNCGTQTKTCTKYCAYTTTACTGQPTNSCVPGTVNYTSAGCTEPQTYRSQTCGANCQYGNLTATCSMATTPNVMTISGTAGQLVSHQWTLDAAVTSKKPDDCPGSSVSTGTIPYVAVEIDNDTNQDATVTIYQSKSPGGRANIDMLMWTYTGAGLPLDDSQLKQCVNGVEDYCLGFDQDVTGNPCGNTGSNFYFAGIDDVMIPKNSKIVVFNSLFTSSTTFGPDNTFMLNVKTKTLQ